MANSTVDDQQGIWGTDFSQVNKQLMVSLMIGKLLITVGKSRGIKFLTVLLRRFSSFLFPRLMEHILKWLSKIIIWHLFHCISHQNFMTNFKTLVINLLIS